MADNNASGVSAATDKGKSWFKGLKAEFNKIIWEDRETVGKQAVSVVVISLILGLIITIVDWLLQNGIDIIVSL